MKILKDILNLALFSILLKTSFSCDCNRYIKKVKPCDADLSVGPKYVAHYMLWFNGGQNYHWCSNEYGASYYTPKELGTDPEFYHTEQYQAEKSRSNSWVYYNQNNCGTVCAHLNEMHGTCLHGLFLNYHSHEHDQVVENVIGAIDSVFSDMMFSIDPDTSEVNNMLVDSSYLRKFTKWGNHRNHYKINGKPLIPAWSSSVSGGVEVDSNFASQNYLMYVDFRTAGGWRPKDCNENDVCTKFKGYFLWIGDLANGNGGMIDGYTGHAGRNVRGVCNLEVKIGAVNRGFRNAHGRHKLKNSYTQCKCGPKDPRWCNESKCNGARSFLEASLLAAEKAPCDLDFVQVITWNDWTEGTAIEAGYEKQLKYNNALMGIDYCATNSNEDGSFKNSKSYAEWWINNPNEALFLDCSRGTESRTKIVHCRNEHVRNFGPNYDLEILKNFIVSRSRK